MGIRKFVCFFGGKNMRERLCVYSSPVPSINLHAKKIDAAKKFGMGGAELFNNGELCRPDEAAAEKLKLYADEAGIKIPCLSAYADFSDTKTDTVESLKGYARVAKKLGSRYLHHTIIPEWSDPDKVLPRKRELYEIGIKGVREVYDYAESLGVRTIFEDQGYIFNGVEGFGNFLADVNRDVGVVADFGNICEADETAEEFIKAFSDRICHVHLKDMLVTEDNPNNLSSMRSLGGRFIREVLPGTGSVNIKGALALLKEINYDGYFGIEYGAKEGNEKEYEAVISYFEELLGQK